MALLLFGSKAVCLEDDFTLIQRNYIVIFCCCCGREMYASKRTCAHHGELGDPFDIALVKDPIRPAFVSLLSGAVCSYSLWNNRSLGTGLTVLAGLVIALGLCLGIISLNRYQRGRGMAIAGVALSALALLVLTKGL